MKQFETIFNPIHFIKSHSNKTVQKFQFGQVNKEKYLSSALRSLRECSFLVISDVHKELQPLPANNENALRPFLLFARRNSPSCGTQPFAVCSRGRENRCNNNKSRGRKKRRHTAAAERTEKAHRVHFIFIRHVCVCVPD